MNRSIAYALLALALAAFGVAMCARDAFAVDCNRLPHVCAEQQAKPVVKRARIVRKTKKFRRQAVQVRRGAPSSLAATPKLKRENEPVSGHAQAPRPVETLMYRQIVPLLVSTTTEPRIIPLPSRMPDLSSRGVISEPPPLIIPSAAGWSRSSDGKTAIALVVLAFVIGSVAYALDQKPKGKRHATARQNRASVSRSILDAFARQIGRFGAGAFRGASQPARIEPHFA